MVKDWECPMCDFKITAIGPGYYSDGHTRDIEKLQEETEILREALHHIIIEHIEGTKDEMPTL